MKKSCAGRGYRDGGLIYAKDGRRIDGRGLGTNEEVATEDRRGFDNASHKRFLHTRGDRPTNSDGTNTPRRDRSLNYAMAGFFANDSAI